MKLAILGSTPMALEAVLRFHAHGAALTWFNMPEEGFHNEGTTERGLELLKTMGAATEIKNWKRDYYGPLCQLLRGQQQLREHEVICITKRFLAPTEIPQGKSRFLDLFRVTFLVNPQDFIQEQKESNPETYERLSEEFVSSLQSNIEMYEDFDVILDLRAATEAGSLSVTGRALGEGRVTKDNVAYGFAAWEMAKAINARPETDREVALVGSGPLAAEILISLESWLKDERSRLFISTHEADPFQDYLSKAEPTKVAAVKKIFHYFDQEFEKETNTFHAKLREWQALDDFVQVKMQKPVEPIPRLVFFSGHNATAIDQLIDKRRLFLTLEKPEFREGLKQPENNILELKTIGADKILVASEFKKKSIQIFLTPQEVGFFSATPTWANYAHAWEQDLNTIKGFEDEIFKLFSPRDAD